MTTPFSGKAAIVTGASQGIGRAIALELSRRGARVVMTARTRETLEAAAREAGASAIPVALDVSAEGAADRLLAEALKATGGLDLLVHSAGAIAHGTMDEAPVADLDRLWAVNVRAPYALTKAALPALRASRGQVAFVNSSITRSPKIATRGQFAATQFALKAVADSLRDEVNRDGIRVVSIYPGTTATPRSARLHQTTGAAYAPERLLQPEDVAQALCDALALPPTAEPTDLYVRQMMPPAAG